MGDTVENPYKIPDDDLPCAIQFSGGRTSGFMLKNILDANPVLPKDFYVLFQNTGREMEETLRFVHDCSVNFGVKITWLEYRAPYSFEVVGYNSASRNGEPFEQLIRTRKSLPNVVNKYCSDVLKYRTAKRYMVSLGYKKYRAVVGLRYDEPSRVRKIHGTKHARQVIWTPLFDAKATKLEVKDFWDNSKFDLNLDNIKGKTPLGNCDGCFLKSERNLAHLCKHYPDKAEWWDKMEKSKIATAKSGARFNRDVSWSQLIDSVDRQTNFDFMDEIGGFCDSIHGTCESF